MRPAELSDAAKHKAAKAASPGGEKRQVTITSESPNLSVTAWLGLDPPQITGGYGGWDVVARPNRQALTVWKGYNPFEMDLPILLDGFVTTSSVEARISALERMGRPPKVLDEPPIIRVEGFVPHSDLSWVLQRIAYGDTIRAENGQRVRQFLTLGLLKYIEADRLEQGNARLSAQNKVKTKKGPHIVKKGETMNSIAVYEYHDIKMAKQIMVANGIRDPKSIKIGQHLRLP